MAVSFVSYITYIHRSVTHSFHNVSRGFLELMVKTFLHSNCSLLRSELFTEKEISVAVIDVKRYYYIKYCDRSKVMMF